MNSRTFCRNVVMVSPRFIPSLFQSIVVGTIGAGNGFLYPGRNLLVKSVKLKKGNGNSAFLTAQELCRAPGYLLPSGVEPPADKFIITADLEDDIQKSGHLSVAPCIPALKSRESDLAATHIGEPFVAP